MKAANQLILLTRSAARFGLALCSYLAEVVGATLGGLQATALAQRYRSRRGGNQIVSEGECGFEKFSGSLCAALGKVKRRNNRVRFVDQIAERLHIVAFAGFFNWHHIQRNREGRNWQAVAENNQRTFRTLPTGTAKPGKSS
jgi:hypothetical protein